MFNVHASSETRFNEKVLFTMGGSFTTLDTDITGSRIYGGGYNDEPSIQYPGIQARDEGFRDLVGGSTIKQYVANLNLMITPADHVTLVPALRVPSENLQRHRMALYEFDSAA